MSSGNSVPFILDMDRRMIKACMDSLHRFSSIMPLAACFTDSFA